MTERERTQKLMVRYYYIWRLLSCSDSTMCVHMKVGDIERDNVNMMQHKKGRGNKTEGALYILLYIHLFGPTCMRWAE
jgi:hypothetical protein